MVKISDALTYGLTLRESVDDGSDFTNPAADYRRLFLGEDGTLHLKSAAGTVTAIGGDITTDAAWAAKGDLIVGTNNNTAAVLTAGNNGEVLTAASGEATGLQWAASAAAGVGWELVVDKPGTDFTGFTAASGTWASDGATINQTDTGANNRRVKWDTVLPLGFPTIIEVELQFQDDGNAGILISDGTNDGGLLTYLDSAGDLLKIDKDSAIAWGSVAFTSTTGVWYKMRVIVGTTVWVSCYLGGVLALTVCIGNDSLRTNSVYPGLWTYSASVKFRNFKVWTLTTGVPA